MSTVTPPPTPTPTATQQPMPNGVYVPPPPPPTAAQAAGQQGYATDVQLTAQDLPYYNTAMQQYLAGMTACIQKVQELEQAAEPKPILGWFNSMINFLQKIPVVGEVASITGGIVAGISNLMDDIQGTGNRLDSSMMTQNLKNNAQLKAQADAVIAVYNGLKAGATRLKETADSLGGTEAYDLQQQSVTQQSMDHRMQLISQGFYSKQQIENGLGHAIVGGGVEQVAKFRARMR